MEQPEGSLLYSPEWHTESSVESDESSHHSPTIFVISICSSARKEQTRLPLDDGFSWNLIFEYFSKMCWRNSSLIKIWQD